MNYPAPFTQKQYDYLQRCMSSWFNVAEGGKRGGKNVLQTMAFCLCLETHPSKLHLVAGVSTTTAGLNILDCDGYGLKNYFEGRCRAGKYEKRDCLYIRTIYGEEKVILISGGGKNGDEKLIKGNTYGMTYVTEANECAEVFLKEVFDRTLSSPERRIFHDLNPKPERHWYYTNILAHHENNQKDNSAYGYNYGHFTIADNLSVPDDLLRKVLATYDKKSVWYKRDILGLRKQAEGLIYDMFRYDKHVVDASKMRYTRYYVSVDYGTQNPFSAGLWGYADGKWVRIREYYYDGRKRKVSLTDEAYYGKLVELIDGLPVSAIVIDPSAASMIACINQHGRHSVVKADNSVLDGIRNMATMLSTGRLLVDKSCKDWISEVELYMWDTSSAEEKPVKEYDHAMDDSRYIVRTIMMKQPSRIGGKPAGW